VSVDVLIVPGLGDSGPTHWQSHWQAAKPRWRRVVQRDWDRPVRDEWIASLDRAVRDAKRRVVLVGHSLACALVAHWAVAHDTEAVAGALLVAPSDVDSPKHTPDEVRGFAPTPLKRLPFRSVVVASSNDPYHDMTRARFLAWRWGSRLVEIGRVGHINSASDLGLWPVGQRLLAPLLGAA
jgi:predicted alpha/beta hydrolase family esterase